MTVNIVTHEDVVTLGAELDQSGELLIIAETDTSTTQISVTEGGRGPQGPPGAGGRTVLVTYVQDIPSAEWGIPYDADYVPLLQVFDSTGALVDVEADYTVSGVVRILAAHPFAGRAYLI